MKTADLLRTMTLAAASTALLARPAHAVRGSFSGSNQATTGQEIGADSL